MRNSSKIAKGYSVKNDAIRFRMSPGNERKAISEWDRTLTCLFYFRSNEPETGPDLLIVIKIQPPLNVQNIDHLAYSSP